MISRRQNVSCFDNPKKFVCPFHWVDDKLQDTDFWFLRAIFLDVNQQSFHSMTTISLQLGVSVELFHWGCSQTVHTCSVFWRGWLLQPHVHQFRLWWNAQVAFNSWRQKFDDPAIGHNIFSVGLCLVVRWLFEVHGVWRRQMVEVGVGLWLQEDWGHSVWRRLYLWVTPTQLWRRVPSAVIVTWKKSNIILHHCILHVGQQQNVRLNRE